MKKTMFQKTVKMRNKTSISYRSEVIAYAKKQYGTLPEYPWRYLPGYTVFRHTDSRKWYGLIMDVPTEKLGIHGKDTVDILEVKCDPILSGSLINGKGICPAYHMKQGGWISVLLDGSVEKTLIFSLLDMSYELTSKQKRNRRFSQGRQEWIVPANPKYYDLRKAFSENEEIIWKQSSNIAVGDVVCLYVAAPVSAVLYRCEATEVNIPYRYDDGNVHMDHVMKLKKLEQYEPSFLSLEKLKSYGISAVRGPRRIPRSLICEMERHRYEQ